MRQKRPTETGAVGSFHPGPGKPQMKLMRLVDVPPGKGRGLVEAINGMDGVIDCLNAALRLLQAPTGRVNGLQQDG